jgi:primosomal protein N'
MIADVVFDLPLDRSFSYRVPPDLPSRITVGQRVRAPLQRRPRVGVVVALRDGMVVDGAAPAPPRPGPRG